MCHVTLLFGCLLSVCIYWKRGPVVGNILIARLTCKSASLLSPDKVSNWIMDNINNRTRTLTAEIVKDFIIHRLQKAGYENDIPGGSQLSFEAPGPAYRSMRMMGDEFYTAYFNAFEDMTGTINIHNGDLKDILFTILEQTCETGLNWGRMVGMFVFSAMLAVKAMACGRTDVVENIIEWASDYLEHERFSNWINQHGGWDGFVQYHANPKTRNQELEHYIWNKACTGVGYLVSGVATFANILMH